MWYMLAELPDITKLKENTDFSIIQEIIGSQEIDLFKDGVWYPLETKRTSSSHIGESMKRIPKQIMSKYNNETEKENLVCQSDSLTLDKQCSNCISSAKREVKLKKKINMLTGFIKTMNHNLEVDALKISNVMTSRTEKLERLRRENVELHGKNNQYSMKLIECEKETHELRILLRQTQTENNTLKELIETLKMKDNGYEDAMNVIKTEIRPEEILTGSAIKKPVSDETISQSNFTSFQEGPIAVSTPKVSLMRNQVTEDSDMLETEEEGTGWKIDDKNQSSMIPQKFLVGPSEDIPSSFTEEDNSLQVEELHDSRDSVNIQHQPMGHQHEDHMACNETCFIMTLAKRAAEVREQLARVNNLVTNYTLDTSLLM